MLEGQVVHLPAPKTHYAKNAVFDKDTPIFATAKQSFIFLKSGVIDEMETEMMRVRCNTFRLHAQIRREEQRNIPACNKCFARLVLAYD